MDLLSGDKARSALQHLLQSAAPALPTLLLDPQVDDNNGTAAPRFMAVATPTHAILINPRQTPDFLALLSAAQPLAAYDAKRVQRVLLRYFNADSHRGPTRWACVKLCEQLLAGGRVVNLDLSAIAARYNIGPLAPIDAGLQEFVAQAQAIACLILEQAKAIKQHQLGWVSKIEAAAVAPIAAMEHVGMPLDSQLWQHTTQAAEQERRSLRQAIIAQLGVETLNLDSSQELKNVLLARGHHLPDTRKDHLAELPAPLGPQLLRYREVTKLVTTYGTAFLQHVQSDGRVHPTFEQIGANTGRMACHHPNLQAMVKGTPHRQCFHPTAGRTFVIADYATCELRILAQMSGDPVFKAAFARGDDLHATVATSMFGKPVSKKENPELRQRAKAINFGLVYGMGAAGLARTLDTDLPSAQKLLERYFTTFPSIGHYLQHTARETLHRGFATTLTGRRLYFSTAGSDAERAQAERVAKNMPIQGTSADITKAALARLHHTLQGLENAHLVNCVHDEIVVECPESAAEAVSASMQRDMLAAAAEIVTNVPMAVDIAVATAWDK